MGRCSWMITKGSKKNKMCNIYSTKKIDDKYYCSSHYKMKKTLDDEGDEDIELLESPEIKKIKKPSPEIKKEVKKNISGSKTNKKVQSSNKKVQPSKSCKEVKNNSESDDKDNENIPTLETNTLDDVIEFEYNKSIKKENSKSEIKRLNEKVDYLLKRINEIHPPKIEYDINDDNELYIDNCDIENDIPSIEVFKKNN